MLKMIDENSRKAAGNSIIPLLAIMFPNDEFIWVFLDHFNYRLNTRYQSVTNSSQTH
jgi:hypothetical protein